LNISWIPQLVIAGIWGATLSSALGSILGAPRILQATATDKITPKFFARGYGPANEPRNALLLTFLIAEAGILIGELNIIARVVSIFFITTYGFLNISAAFERWTSTDFRPEFKVSGWISLIGAVACLVVMIQLDFVAMLGATAIMIFLFLFLKRKELRLDSGDAWSGVWASMVKSGLVYLKRERIHKRNWRPNIIMFTCNPQNRKHMIEIGEAISGSLGILSGFELIKSNTDIFRREKSVLMDEKYSSEYFHHRVFCSNIYKGMDQVVRMYGFSGIEPNTILMGWSKNPGNKDQFIEVLQTFRSYKYNTIFLNFHHEQKYGSHQSIDFWWGGSGRNLAMAINIIRHIKNSHLWKSAYVRLLIINQVNENYEDIYRSAASILEDYREDIEIKIVNNQIESKTQKEIIAAESKNTDLVIMELPDQRFNQLKNYYDEISETFNITGGALVINASEDFEEMEVVTNDKKDILSFKDGESFVELEMTPLIPSGYSEVATDILKIEMNGQKVLELFHKKTFQPVIRDHMAILDELSGRIKFIQRESVKLQEFPDLYRRRRGIDKLKNEVLFQINELFNNNLKEIAIPDQMDRISEGITWYENRLKEDFYKYPDKLKIKYQKEDFKISRDERFSSILFKISKKVKHTFAGYPITNQVPTEKWPGITSMITGRYF
jgi:amino acid transporter